MKFHSNKLLLTAVLGGMCVFSAVPVEAGCHGRSGGYSHGSGYSSHMSYHRPAYPSSVHLHAVQTHPIYPQPVYPYPEYSQQVYAQSQPISVQTRPLPTFGPEQAGVQIQQGFATQQSLPAQQGFLSAGQTPGQTGTLPTPPGGFANNPSASTPQVGVQSQTALSGAATQSPSELAASGVQSPAAVTPVGSPPVDAQQSALQALGGFAPPQNTAVVPEFAPTAVQQNAPTLQPAFAGMWTANLANGARIQLALQTDGNFSWTALNKEGQSSVFQGTYAVENGSLSLTRSNDRQQLSGTMTVTGTNTFSFRLSVAPSSSIDFVRS